MAEVASGPIEVEIAGMRLRFQQADPGLVQIHEMPGETWAANAFNFEHEHGPLLYPNFAYHDRIGADDRDPRGNKTRPAIREAARRVYVPRPGATQQAEPTP